MVVGTARREGEPRVGPSRKQVRVHIELLVHFIDRGDVQDAQADRDVDRPAVFTWRMQQRIDRDAARVCAALPAIAGSIAPTMKTVASAQ